MDIFLKSRLRPSKNLLNKVYSETDGRKKYFVDLGNSNYLADIYIPDHTLYSSLQWPVADLNHLHKGYYDKLKQVVEKSFCITSFEVFEHLYNLFPVLQVLRECDLPLIASVPLRFPFSKQYWTDDYFDRHYNEFEPKQFRWILKEARFKITHEEMWKLEFNMKGIRPFIKSFYPIWMAVICK